MHNQIAFSQTEEFRRFMNGLTLLESQEIIHGVFIDLHPVWRSIIDMEKNTGITNIEYIHLLNITWPFSESSNGGPYDSEYIPESWERITSMSGKSTNPFIVKIYVVPTSRGRLDMRRDVERYARSQPFFTVVIDEPISILASNIEGGGEINATSPGTLGGFLIDAGGNKWGVTCGHVAQQVNGTITLDDISGMPIANAGIVKYTNFSNFSSIKSGVCNQYINVSHSEVDAALIELGSNHTILNTVKSIGQIDDIYDRTQLNSGNTVAMRGAVSGRVDYIIGGYGVTCKVILDGGAASYCFSNLFEIYATPTAPSWLPGRIAQATSRRPMKGDSGSWICFNHYGNRYAYFGNLIAVRGTTGIATFADALVSWAKKAHGLQLAPF